MTMFPLQSLQCPACGHADNEIVRERGFGAEIHCRACGTRSAMITRRDTGSRASNGRACGSCGNFNSPRTRFCQCGRDLKRPCCYCTELFSCDDHVCPHCGWDHDPKAGSAPAMEARARALNEGIEAQCLPDLPLLEKRLVESFVQRGDLSQSAERALKRLVLQGYERGGCHGYMNRWRDEPGLKAVDRWDRRLRSFQERRELFERALEWRAPPPGVGMGDGDGILDELAKRTRSGQHCGSWALGAAGIFLWMILAGMDLGLLGVVIASGLVVSAIAIGKAATERFKAAVTAARSVAENQWQAWLREYGVPPRTSPLNTIHDDPNCQP